MILPVNFYKRRLRALTRDLRNLEDDSSEWAFELRTEIRIRIAEVVRMMLEEDESSDTGILL